MEEISSSTGGVKPIPIQGRLEREKERLKGMTDEERKWRAQWIRDQKLAPHEPVHVPEIDIELRNPIRRICSYPLDQAFKPLQPVLGSSTRLVRYLTGKALMALAFTYGTIYYFKYNGNDWTKRAGWRVTKSRQIVLPGDPGYPQVSKMRPQDYNTRGFESSPI